jgi:hypothetical protein
MLAIVGSDQPYEDDRILKHGVAPAPRPSRVDGRADDGAAVRA